MRSILVLVDFSTITPTVTETAGELARAMGAKLCLFHASMPEAKLPGYEIGPDVARDLMARELRDDRHQLHDLEKSLEAQGFDVATLLVHGLPIDRALEAIERVRPALVVMGSHGRGALRHLLLGSVSTAILRKAPCPVVLVPTHLAPPM